MGSKLSETETVAMAMYAVDTNCDVRDAAEVWERTTDDERLKTRQLAARFLRSLPVPERIAEIQERDRELEAK